MPSVPSRRAIFVIGMSVGSALALIVSGCSRQSEDSSARDEHAPDSYKARFDTSKGQFVVAVTRAWAPVGADRFYTLVKNGFYDGARFFRVVPGFVVQFGIAADPAVNAKWRNANIQDDPVTQSNKPGMVTFAAARTPNSRSTQVFINLADNSRLDATGFAPFGTVSDGMDVVQQFYGEYGEGPPMGPGPDQARAQTEGNAYLIREFPKLDYIRKATIEK